MPVPNGEGNAPGNHFVNPTTILLYFSRYTRRRIVRRPPNQGEVAERLLPVEHPSTHDITWLAGVIEGEAGIHIDVPRLHVTQVDPWLPNRLRVLFGGSVTLHAPTSAGNPTHVWAVSGT